MILQQFEQLLLLYVLMANTVLPYSYLAVTGKLMHFVTHECVCYMSVCVFIGTCVSVNVTVWKYPIYVTVGRQQISNQNGPVLAHFGWKFADGQLLHILGISTLSHLHVLIDHFCQLVIFITYHKP